jgi:hypothetical protein
MKTTSTAAYLKRVSEFLLHIWKALNAHPAIAAKISKFRLLVAIEITTAKMREKIPIRERRISTLLV